MGFLYPVYMSFKTLERPTTPLLRQWLMYWIVYGVFTTCEHISDKIFAWSASLPPSVLIALADARGCCSAVLRRVPFYNPLKLLFLLWCFLPRYNVIAADHLPFVSCPD